MRRGVLLLLALGLTVACAVEKHPAAPSAGAAGIASGSVTRFDFEGDALGLQPATWSAEHTGAGANPVWQVQSANDAPSGKLVVAQIDADATGSRFPLLLTQRRFGADVFVSVRFKSLSGMVDRAAGLVVRAQGRDDYYVARANALEDNVRLYKVIGGVRTQLASADATVAPGVWHALGLSAQGSTLRVEYDGRVLIEAQDETLHEGGAVGLWTKADSVTLFDDVSIAGS